MNLIRKIVLAVFLIPLLSIALKAQIYSVTGLVSDADSNALSEVSIVLLSVSGITSDTFVTDANGKFQLNAVAGEYKLSVINKGFKEYSKTVSVSADADLGLISIEKQKGLVQRFIEWIIKSGGLYFLLLIVFAETGLFVGFLFPGDSLLFTAGIYAEDLAREFFGLHFGFVIFLVIVASIIGNYVGYWFGAKYGVKLFQREDSFFFKKKHLQRAKDYYDHYGKSTVFLAKFLPIIRTFVPIVAGIVKMERKTFSFYNITGSLAWVLSMMLSGHYLQTWVLRRFGFSLKDHIEGIAIAIIVVTTLPVIYKIFFGKKKAGTLEAGMPIEDKSKD